MPLSPCGYGNILGCEHQTPDSPTSHTDVVGTSLDLSSCRIVWCFSSSELLIFVLSICESARKKKTSRICQFSQPKTLEIQSKQGGGSRSLSRSPSHKPTEPFLVGNEKVGLRMWGSYVYSSGFTTISIVVGHHHHHHHHDHIQYGLIKINPTLTSKINS